MLNKENIALIDADTVIYIATYNKKDEPKREIKEMFNICDNILDNILFQTKTDKYCGFLTDSKCFRHKIGKQQEYKGNRKDFIKPKYYSLIKSYLMDELGFVSNYPYEADDLCIMSYNSLKEVYNPIICSPDKDLTQIGATFFNYKKGELFTVTEEEAVFNLWSQILTGDVSDNILGLQGIGKIKAAKFLYNLKSEEFKFKVLECYIKAYGEYDGISNFTENYKLCKMLDKTLEGELYNPIINKRVTKESIDEWMV